MDAPSLPADYAIDALALETDKRCKALGRPYSYGQLIADTTPEQREQIAEDYRKAMVKTGKKGRHWVNTGAALMPEASTREVEDAVCQKLEAQADGELEGE